MLSDMNIVQGLCCMRN